MEMGIHNRAIDMIADWGTDLIKDNVSGFIDKREIRKMIEDYMGTQFKSNIYSADIDSEIDYEGLNIFVIKHFDEIQKYIFNTEVDSDEKLLANLLRQAESFSNANTEVSKKVVNNFLSTVIKLTKNFYMDRIPDSLKLTISTLNENARRLEKKQAVYYEEILKEFNSLHHRDLREKKEDSISIHKFLTDKPAVSGRIIGREIEVKEFIELYSNDNKILIMGVGGIGKSELAKCIYWSCTEVNDTFQYFGWMSFDKDIKYTFVKYIKGNFSEKTVDTLFEEILNYLECLNGRILIIIDNVPANIDTINQIESILLHNNNLCIILTSRITELEGFEPYLVKPLKVKYCFQLFFMYAKHIQDNENNRVLVKEIIDKIAMHTLSIEVIAKSSWVNKTSLEELHEKILQFKYPRDFKLPIKIRKDEVLYQEYCFRFLKYVFNDVTSLSDKQKEILFFLSALPYQEYDFNLILKWIAEENLSVLNELIQCGWVQAKNNEKCTISVHPLISEVSTDSLDIEIVRFSEYFKNICLWNKENEDNFNFIAHNSAIFTELFYRYESLLKPDSIASEDIIYLGESGVNMLHSLAEYDKAYDLCVRVIKAKEIVYGEKSIRVIDSCNDLAVICKDLGRYSIALELLRKADELLELFPDDLEERAKVYNSMAGIYRVQGDIPLCIQYLEKSLELRENCLKADDKLIAITCNNLANIYRDNGRITDAKKILDKAIYILQKLPDENHPLLATAYYNYGLIFMKKEEEDLMIARKYILKAYDIRKKSLGLNHPHTKLAVDRLGELDQLQCWKE